MTARAPGEPVPAFLARLRVEVGKQEGNPRGISQEEAARRAGVNREQWNRWEGETRLTAPNAEKVAAAFGLDPDDLLEPRSTRAVAGRLAQAEAELARIGPILTALADRVEALERQAGREGPQEAAR